EHGNFSEAALHLDVTQSTISHAIATLEAELGIVLFHRGRHGAQLTPTGDRIVAYAQQIHTLLDGILNEADNERGLKGGTVRLAAFRSVATHVLPGAIARLRQRYPDIHITLHEFDEVYQLKQAVVQGQVDVCVAEVLCSKEFECIHILDDEYIALLPPSSGLCVAQVSLEDLSRFPLIASSHDSCFTRIEQQLQALGNVLKVQYLIRHDSSMTSMVQQGLGIAILPRLAAEPIPEGVKACRLPFKLSRPIGASLLKEGLHSPAVYAFLDALRETGEFCATARAV
ncbi:MAG: LysR family transcriptional regulator, partial [Leptolyngbyaceae cyanobacterium T60_A2020_046]|nr:LysR family transcriptional regulator [Leptolyngbyaceae cyanobacterium T60_A2020_046]